MRRREFIALVGSAPTWPLAARAQQPEHVKRLGVLLPYAENDSRPRELVALFRQELRRLGWVETKNLIVDERWAGDDLDRVRAYTAELINLKPDALFASGDRVVPIVKKQSQLIPIVFVAVGDAVETGLVASLAHPGGNLTGFVMLEHSIIRKSLEILKEIAPKINRAALIFNPDNPASVAFLRLFREAAALLAVQASVFPVHQRADIEEAVAEFAREPNGGLYLPPDLTTFIHRELIINLAARYHLPAVYTTRTWMKSGGLASYGAELADQWQRAASYVDRILRGERPVDLPVQLPTRYELVINLKTAKALGLTVPPSLLARADDVIE